MTEDRISNSETTLHYLEFSDMLNILAPEVCGFVHHLVFLFITTPLENLEESLKEVSLSLPTSDVFVFQDLIINLRLERGLSNSPTVREQSESSQYNLEPVDIYRSPLLNQPLRQIMVSWL